MEKHKCKLCFKSYANGRSLGGHMRSHMMNLPIQSKPEHQQQPSQLNNEAESASSPSSSSSSEDEHEIEQEKGLLIYGLRENPKKSFRLADPVFAFAATVDASAGGSVVLQDRESETESSKNPTRRRSKRTRKLNIPHNHDHHHQQHQEDDVKIKKMKCSKLGQAESWAEPEPVSSVSDATTEEDVAFCLMMLSRDKWIKNQMDEREEQEQEIGEREAIEDSYESDDIKLCKIVRNRGKYKCETCNKVFKSYQALGGHRASHKKMRVTTTATTTTTTFPEMELENGGTSMVADRKIHECPVCYRVFSSGQALGGHKRSHVMGSAPTTITTTPPVKNSAKFGEILIDLNLPAPVDDDDDDQFELSVVSDAEFVNHLR